MTRTSLTLEVARSVIDAALAKAADVGTKVSVAVLDEAGRLKAFASEEGARPLSIQAAQDKAFTSIAFGGVDTAEFSETIAADERLLAVFCAQPRVMLLYGGMPLRIDGELVGAVGVSGGSDPQDHTIAKAGAQELGS